eukprot:SAG31_NODE_8840_length_1377_cov_1.197966_2_plen_67_part_00
MLQILAVVFTMQIGQELRFNRPHIDVIPNADVHEGVRSDLVQSYDLKLIGTVVSYATKFSTILQSF